MKKHIKWLISEIDGWVKDGIIEASQGELIRTRYPSPDSAIPWSKIIFSSIGAVVFGLGVILLFAYNWEKMHKFVKLGVIFAALLSAHGAGIWLRRPESKFKPAGEGLHVLGTMLFGAGIWLVAQIYHIEEHYPNALLIWGIGALGLAWAIPSIPQAIIASILFVLWNGFEAFDFKSANHAAPILILASIMPLAWLQKSRVLVGTVICSFLLAVSFSSGSVNEQLILYVLFFCSCALIAAGLMVQQKNLFPQSAPIFSFFGYLVYLTILYIRSFKEVERHVFTLQIQNIPMEMYFSIPAVIAFGFWLMVFLPVDKLREHFASETLRIDHLGVPIALIIFILQSRCVTGFTGWESAGVFNLIFLFHAIMLIRYGCRTVNVKLTTIGCLLFSLLAVTRYVDLFESLIMRAIVFFIIGAAIFIAGNFYSKTKRLHRETQQ